MPQQTVFVYNDTDGFLACPEPFTVQQARKFIRNFPKRYRRQGYYLTAMGERIPPDKVELILLDENWEPVND